jgi:hypothetical protein
LHVGSHSFLHHPHMTNDNNTVTNVENNTASLAQPQLQAPASTSLHTATIIPEISRLPPISPEQRSSSTSQSSLYGTDHPGKYGKVVSYHSGIRDWTYNRPAPFGRHHSVSLSMIIYTASH